MAATFGRPSDRAETTQVRKTGNRESGTHGSHHRFLPVGVIAIAIIFTGCRFLLAPSTAAAAYGVPAGAEPHLRAYLSAKGIRDIASGLFAAILITHGSGQVLGWFMLAATLIPIGDAGSYCWKAVAGQSRSAYTAERQLRC
jgi:hypothetical protein